METLTAAYSPWQDSVLNSKITRISNTTSGSRLDAVVRSVNLRVKAAICSLNTSPRIRESSTIREQTSFIYFFELFLTKYVTAGSTIKANISSQNFMSLHLEQLMNEKEKKRRGREGEGEKSKQQRGLPNPLLAAK